jgi:hypothetical protein
MKMVDKEDEEEKGKSFGPSSKLSKNSKKPENPKTRGKGSKKQEVEVELIPMLEEPKTEQPRRRTKNSIGLAGDEDMEEDEDGDMEEVEDEEFVGTKAPYRYNNAKNKKKGPNAV